MFHLKTGKMEKSSNVVLDFLKGLIFATLLSLGLVVLFAFMIKWFDLSDKIIFPVTMIIKVVSVILGAIFAVHGEKKGLFKGMIFGILYIFLAFLIFSILSGSFSFGISGFLDLISAIIVGGIVGIIKVNRA